MVGVAQLVEPQVVALVVVGSSPITHPIQFFLLKPLENVQFCSISRKVKILTAGIHISISRIKILSLTRKLDKRGRFPEA